MKLILVGREDTPIHTVQSEDFLGCVRERVTLQPDSGHVLILPKRFAWNTFTIVPEVGTTCSVSLTLSSQIEIGKGLASWVPLEDYQNIDKPVWYMWEHPLTAFLVQGEGTIQLNMASKQE